MYKDRKREDRVSDAIALGFLALFCFAADLREKNKNKKEPVADLKASKEVIEETITNYGLCFRCGGGGKMRPVMTDTSSAVPLSTDCPMCGGTGKTIVSTTTKKHGVA